MTVKNKYRLFGLLLGLILGLIALIGILNLLKKEPSAVSAITREGVVTEVKKLNRLTTVAYGVDTVIIAQKAGSWYKLWQDEQKGLFVAKGRVLAGVDLSKLTPDMVQVVHAPQTDPKIAPKATITIELPLSEVFEVFLDDIQVYDWQTGLFGIVDNDPEILKQAQAQGKIEVLSKACEGKIMTLALDNAKESIKGIFAMSGAEVLIKADKVGQCRIGTNINSPNS